MAVCETCTRERYHLKTKFKWTVAVARAEHWGRSLEGLLENEPKGAPTLPNIPVDPDLSSHVQMAQYEDDGMGGRLNASFSRSPFPPRPTLSTDESDESDSRSHNNNNDGHTTASPVAAGFVGGQPGERTSFTWAFSGRFDES